MTRPTDEDIASYFDAKVGCCSTRRGLEKKIWDRATAMLHSAVTPLALGRSVVELGCGEGHLLRELVGAGASRGTGIDLSPAQRR